VYTSKQLLSSVILEQTRPIKVMCLKVFKKPTLFSIQYIITVVCGFLVLLFLMFEKTVD